MNVTTNLIDSANGFIREYEILVKGKDTGWRLMKIGKHYAEIRSPKGETLQWMRMTEALENS